MYITNALYIINFLFYSNQNFQYGQIIHTTMYNNAFSLLLIQILLKRYISYEF